RPRRRTVCGAGLFAANYGRRLSTFAFFPICRQIFGAQIREKRSVLSITRRKLGSDFSDALGGSRQGHSDGIACQTVYGTCLRRKPQLPIPEIYLRGKYKRLLAEEAARRIGPDKCDFGFLQRVFHAPC